VRSRFPPPSSLKQLEDVLHEEWYSIPLQSIQNLHESIEYSELTRVYRVFRTYTSLFQRYNLHYGEVVAQLRINKEMCNFHNCFHYFVRPLFCSFIVTAFTSADISANL